MTRIAILRNRPVQLLRNELVGVLARLPALRRRMGAQLAEIDLSYPNSPLNGGADRHAICRPGERIARPGLAAQLRSGRFVVLNGAPLPEEFSAIAVNGTLDGFPAGTIHVVRPDGYLAMSTSRDDEAQAYLAALQMEGLLF